VVLHDAVGDRQAEPAFWLGALVEKNGSKIRERMSAGMPGPVSATLRRTFASCTFRRTTMRPDAAPVTASSAFRSRLTTACSSCPASPSTRGTSSVRCCSIATPSRPPHASARAVTTRATIWCRSTGAASGGWGRTNVWSSPTIRAARMADSAILATRSAPRASRALRLSMAAWPMMVASGLLTSWATPVTSWPTAASLLASMSRFCFSSRRWRWPSSSA